MSTKIFFFQLLGRIKPVEKIESQRHILHNEYLQFKAVESSDELKEFLELKQIVTSEAFKTKKAEIKSLHFKGSNEEEILKEFTELKKNSQIKRYFKVKDSSELKRYESLKDSDKIREFLQLTDFVENGSFRRAKDDAKQQVYRGSDEEEQEREYKKLKKSPLVKAFMELHNSAVLKRHESTANSEKHKKYYELINLPDKDKDRARELKNLKSDHDIRDYLKFDQSRKYKTYREAIDSYILKRFNELKPVVESGDFQKRVWFLKDKKKFEKSDAYKKFKRLKELSRGDDIKFYLKYGKSPLLKNYYDTQGTDILNRFQELSEMVSSEEFIRRKAYLEDPKKWEKSDECINEQKYLEMKKRPHLVKYFDYKDSARFDFFTKWELSFEDDFSGVILNPAKWSTISLWAEKMPGRNFSMPGDLHIFTEGKNVKTGGKLIIETRREKSGGLAWNPAAGFIPSNYDYTSGLVSTGKSFSQADGIYEAKVRFKPVKEVVSSFVLQGEKNSPRVHLFEIGTKNRSGVSYIDHRGKLQMEGLDISNLKSGKWYIFTLKKEGSLLIWKINETEVLRLEKPEIDFPLHLNILSIVVDEIPGSKLPVRFQTDWVKCYRQRLS
ncbi:MAG: hypothetical protein GX126_14170 [Bacteroidales bacterium]|jgi:hypothetical protein|nr:hypothetical protein [Bacteroidales bacterium]